MYRKSSFILYNLTPRNGDAPQMKDLVPLDNTHQTTPLVYQLDSDIIEHLPKRNTGQGLSENTKRTYLSAIKDFNRFLVDKNLPVSPLAQEGSVSESRL